MRLETQVYLHYGFDRTRQLDTAAHRTHTRNHCAYNVVTLCRKITTDVPLARDRFSWSADFAECLPCFNLNTDVRFLVT